MTWVGGWEEPPLLSPVGTTARFPRFMGHARTGRRGRWPLGRLAGPSGNPVQQEERRHEEGIDSVKRVAYRMRVPIDRDKDGRAESRGNKAEEAPCDGAGSVKPTHPNERR